MRYTVMGPGNVYRGGTNMGEGIGDRFQQETKYYPYKIPKEQGERRMERNFINLILAVTG